MTHFKRESAPASGCPVSRNRGIDYGANRTSDSQMIVRIDFCDEIDRRESKGLRKNGSVPGIRSAFFAVLRNKRSKSATPVCMPVMDEDTPQESTMIDFHEKTVCRRSFIKDRQFLPRWLKRKILAFSSMFCPFVFSHTRHLESTFGEPQSIVARGVSLSSVGCE